MLPVHTLDTLRRRPVLRRSLSLVGYVGGAVLMICGVVAFWADDIDTAMASGWPLLGGILLAGATHEVRTAIRALPARKPDPLNPSHP